MQQEIHNQLSLQNIPIRHKLLIVTLLVALLTSITSLAGIQLVTRQFNRMLYTQTAGSLNAISDKVATRLNNLMEISLYIAVNQGFQSNLSIINETPNTSAHGVARSEISSLLYRTFHSDIITISVFPLKANPIVLGLDSSLDYDEIQERVLAMATEAKGAPVWLSTNYSDGSVLLAREIRNVNEQPFLEPLGLLMLRVNLDKIVRESTEPILSGEYDIVISQNGEHFYPVLSDGSNLLSEIVFSDNAPYAIDRQNSEISFVARSHIQAYRLNWDFLLGIPYNDVFYSLISANVLFVVCLVFAAILTILLSRRMLSGINRDIRLLTVKMNRVRKGDLQPYPNPSSLGWDELGTLNRHFDKMTADFKQVIDDNYVKHLLLTQTQLKALEQQINPHFLYNSLEAINSFARSEESKNVAIIAQALGRLLRGTLSENKDLIPLKQEITILESYLSIQQIRFPDTLRVHVQVDKAAMDVLIPKMSIQPLVENAVVHSLEENIGECHIYIRVALKQKMIQVEVENDGSEIDVNIMDKLQEKKVQPKGNGIGLINIDSRIKLLFGQEYGIRLESLKNRVIVSFCIPSNNDESSDSEIDKPLSTSLKDGD